MRKKILIEEKELYKLYINLNLTTKEIAAKLSVSVATINRLLKQFNITKDDQLRKEKISQAKQNKTEEEKIIYSQHISEARRGKGIGQVPWNKGKHTGNSWKGRHHTEKTKKKIIASKNNKSPEEKAIIEAKRKASRVYKDPWNKGKHTGAWTEEQKAIILAKQYKTKKQKRSFNSSKPEDLFYETLVIRYGINNVEREYSIDKRYPFSCDFYIKSKDLFIELNLHWSHGGHPFDNSNPEDINKLNIWKEKAKTSEFYKNAIETWTIRDVKKHLAVKENNLNYIEYYSEIDMEKYTK